MKIVDVETAAKELNLTPHSLKFTEVITFREFGAISRLTDKIGDFLRLKLKDNDASVEIPSENEVVVDGGRVRVRVTPVLKSDTEKEVATTWNLVVNSLITLTYLKVYYNSIQYKLSSFYLLWHRMKTLDPTFLPWWQLSANEFYDVYLNLTFEECDSLSDI